MKTMFFFALILVSVPLFAQPAPDSDAEFLNIRYVYTLESDGATSMNYSHELTMYTSFAFSRAYGETFIVYNPVWQELKIHSAVTRMADGKEVEAPANAYNEVLPGFAHNALPYSHLRELVLTHTGLEPGATVHLDYTISSIPGFMPGLMDRVVLAQRSPVNNIEIVVRVPKGKTLYRKLCYYTGAVDSSMRQEGKYDVYSWKLKQLPLIAVESSQPPMAQFAPQLVFSTATEQELADHIMKAPMRYDLSPAAVAAAKDAAKDADGMVKKALALQKYITSHVAVMRGGMQYTGYQPMNAQTTYDKAVGSELDVAVLYAAMCRAVGVNALPTLISDFRIIDTMRQTTKLMIDQSVTPSKINSSSAFVPCLQMFGSAGIAIDESDGMSLDLSLFDATAVQQTSGAAQLFDRLFLHLEDVRKNKVTPHIKQYRRGKTVKYKSTSDWIIREDRTLTGRTAVEATSALAADYNPDAMGKSVAKALASAGWGCAAQVEEAKVLGIDDSGVEVKIDSKQPSPAGGDIVFDLPKLGHIASLHLHTIAAPRSTPVDIRLPISEEHLMTIHMPKGMRVFSLPEKAEVSNSVGSVKSIFINHGTDIEIVRSITLPDIVQPSEYSKLAELINVWNDPVRNRLRFELVK